MHVFEDLGIHADRLVHLSYLDYYNDQLNNDANELAKVIHHVIENPSKFDDFDLPFFCDAASIFCLHLEGTTKENVPFAINHCLQEAISDWIPLGEHKIVHSLVDEKNFYYDSESWITLYKLAKHMDSEVEISENLVFVGSPRFYSEIPHFCSSSLHEIGHHIDNVHGISWAALEKSVEENTNLFPSISHCEEHFADFFEASYTGYTFVDVINAMAPNAEESKSHPATSVRIKLVERFLNGEEFAELAIFQEILKVRNLPLLKPRFTIPDFKSSFDDLCPYEIKNNSEMYGLLSSGFTYQNEMKTGAAPAWSKGLSSIKQTQIVADLIEKSIRNYVIQNNSAPSINLEKSDRDGGENSSGLRIFPRFEGKQFEDRPIELRLGYDFLVPVQSLNPPLEQGFGEEGYRAISRHFCRKRRELGERFILKPNQFVLATTVEYVAMPEINCAEVFVDKRFDNCGISFRTKIEPAHRGCVPVELINIGNKPVELVVGEKMFHMTIEQIGDFKDRPSVKNKHLAQIRPELQRLSNNTTLEQLQNFI